MSSESHSQLGRVHLEPGLPFVQFSSHSALAAVSDKKVEIPQFKGVGECWSGYGWSKLRPRLPNSQALTGKSDGPMRGEPQVSVLFSLALLRTKRPQTGSRQRLHSWPRLASPRVAGGCEQEDSS